MTDIGMPARHRTEDANVACTVCHDDAHDLILPRTQPRQRYPVSITETVAGNVQEWRKIKELDTVDVVSGEGIEPATHVLRV